MAHENSLIVKDNVLINANYNLESTEQRLIFLAIIKAREEKKGIDSNTPIQIHASEYAKHFKVTKEAAYSALKCAVDNLFGRYFTYTLGDEGQEKELVKSRWVSRISYKEDSAILTVIFAPDVIPLITNLDKRFTAYELKQITGLKGKYSIRIYEILIAWKSRGYTNPIKLEAFRKMIGLKDHEYLKMSNFKNKVLDSTMKEINKQTDIIATYDQEKNGREISGFVFKFTYKNNPQELELKTINLTEKQISLFAHKLAYDNVFASQYAQVGEEYSDLEARLKIQLRDSEFLDKARAHFERLELKI